MLRHSANPALETQYPSNLLQQHNSMTVTSLHLTPKSGVCRISMPEALACWPWPSFWQVLVICFVLHMKGDRDAAPIQRGKSWPQARERSTVWARAINRRGRNTRVPGIPSIMQGFRAGTHQSVSTLTQLLGGITEMAVVSFDWRSTTFPLLGYSVGLFNHISGHWITLYLKASSVVDIS